MHQRVLISITTKPFSNFLIDRNFCALGVGDPSDANSRRKQMPIVTYGDVISHVRGGTTPKRFLSRGPPPFDYFFFFIAVIITCES